MKKILIIFIIILSIFIIYLTTIDKKVYYLVLGDQISLGMTQKGYYEKSYSEYIKEYLEQKNKLERYENEYVTLEYHITDIISDINKNKEIEETNKTIKNSLIKADLITMSIGSNDILSKINNEQKLVNLNYNQLKKNIDEIIRDLDKLLNLIRQYCKEDIILIGIYINTYDEELNNIIHYANEKFKETSNSYNVTYIDLYEIVSPQGELNMYPSSEEYKKISSSIIDIIDNNLLDK